MHGVLPTRLRVTGVVPDPEILAEGSFGVVRSGTHDGRRIAVKTIKILDSSRDEIREIRKVKFSGVLAATRRVLNHSTLAILQGSHSLGRAVSHEHPEIHWDPGGHCEFTVRHFVRVDGEWNDHGLYRKERRQ